MRVFDKLVQRSRQKRVARAVRVLGETRVGEILTKYIVTARPEDSLISTATKMIAEDVSCLIVMQDGDLKGIVSERDFLNKVPLNSKVFSMSVDDIMTPKVVMIKPDAALPAAVALMKKHGFRRLVVEEEGRILGIVTQADFARQIRGAFTAIPSSFPVSRIMKKAPVTTSGEQFRAAQEKMKRANVGAVIVASRQSRPHEIQGFFSEYDVVMQLYDQKDVLNIRDVKSFTRKYVRAITEEMSIFEANNLLLQKNIHRLPVVSQGNLRGIVTQTEIIRFIYLHLDDILKKTADPLRRLDPGEEFDGRFESEHLKVYLPSLK